VPEQDTTPPAAIARFSRSVGAQEERKLMTRRSHAHVWPSLGMLGLIGWSVCLPTVLGAWLGAWLDHRQVDRHGWTLSLLVAGLCLGCANAWHWIAKEQNAIRRGQESGE
jgi:ATP synthase protein I